MPKVCNVSISRDLSSQKGANATLSSTCFAAALGFPASFLGGILIVLYSSHRGVLAIASSKVVVGERFVGLEKSKGH